MYSIILGLNQCCVTNRTEYKASSVCHLLNTPTGSEGPFLIEKRDLSLCGTLSQWPSSRGGTCLMPTLPVCRDIHIVRRREKCVCVFVWEQPVGHGGVRWEGGACRLHHPGSELQRLPPTPQVGPSYFRIIYKYSCIYSSFSMPRVRQADGGPAGGSWFSRSEKWCGENIESEHTFFCFKGRFMRTTVIM